MDQKLPKQFSHLEKFIEYWAEGDRATRLKKRVNATPEGIAEFYNAFVPVLDDAVAYLNQYDVKFLENMPVEAKNLLNLSFMMMEVAPCVEHYGGQPDLDAYPADRVVITL